MITIAVEYSAGANTWQLLLIALLFVVLVSDIDSFSIHGRECSQQQRRNRDESLGYYDKTTARLATGNHEMSLSSFIKPSLPRLDRLTLNQNNIRRRLLTFGFVGATIHSFKDVNVQPALGVSAAGTSTGTDVGETIRRSAANVPGYGPTDIFYPLDWQGTWNVRREVILPKTSPSTDQPPEVIVLNYPIRFIQSIQDNAVVADRGFNQASLERSIRINAAGGSKSDSSISDPIRSYRWSESNPNDIFLEFYDGSLKYIKVTKRSSEYDTVSNTVSSSEYQRVTQDDMSTSTTALPGKIPTITARRIVSKWRPVLQSDSTALSSTTNAIEAIEIVYDVGTSNSNDPLSFQPKQQSQTQQIQPIILSKSKLYLQRTQRII
jgi:hypothetical protein